MKLQISEKICIDSKTNQQVFPDTEDDFLYRAERSIYRAGQTEFSPLHWHRELEFFYVESGYIVYHTPNITVELPPGSVGVINTNILHRTYSVENKPAAVILQHKIDPAILRGVPGGKIDKKYFRPYLRQESFEILWALPEEENKENIIQLMKKSFSTDDEKPGYELRIRHVLSMLWLEFISALGDEKQKKTSFKDASSNESIRKILQYIYENYKEKIYVKDLADVAYISERACFRLFFEYLNMTPAEYIQNYRVTMACDLLEFSDMPITEIGRDCCLGSSSYFGKVFKEKIGCSPLAYRKTKKGLA